MSTYSDLQQDVYYLIKETEDDELMLVKPVMATSKCVLLVGNDGDSEYTFWKQLDDDVAEIVDELTEEEAEAYEDLFEDDDDDDY
ncbi:MAG: hypothetical protein EOO10_18700 [Chitinophagaceae bacterium]|nr:MAG: hypothetical protein EOO10_18700 [Chitinophagaceae bacterium]